MDIQGFQKVFITGADKGLGFSLASRFLREGFQVFAGVYVSADNLQILLQDYASHLTLVPLDVTDLSSIRKAVLQVAGLTPAMDILVNNAAVYPQNSAKPLYELNLDDGHLDQTINVNSLGPLRVTQQFLPLLENGTRKLIVNISSEAGSINDCMRTSEFAYCMSKAALNMQSRILQNALAPQGFRVLVIHPGWMRTDMGGPEAEIHPDEAALKIFDLVLKPRGEAEPIYIDYHGNPLPW